MRHKKIGLKIRGLRPYFDENLETYVADCPDEGCDYLIKENEIHQGQGRCYLFSVDDDE